jgi:poly(3-hydroxybutyrate) depolymerase
MLRGRAAGIAAAALAPALAACTATSAAGDPPPPQPAGCITEVGPGAHAFTCEGLRTDAFIPAQCARPGCGLVLELHGDTGTGPLLEANTGLMPLGAARGYIVVAPTGPPHPLGVGSTWELDDDDKLMAIARAFAGVFRTDPRKTHLTGFSRGGYVTWRMLCEHADAFASVAPAAAGSAPGGACDGVQEVSCPFDATQANGMPARPIPVLFLVGRTDVPVPYGCMTRIRDQAIAGFQLGAPSMLDGDAGYTHTRWQQAGGGRGLLEIFEHAYETIPDGPEAALRGHCIPGSTFDPYAPEYAVACAPPNAFAWGAEVMRFFAAHPDL